MNTTVAGTPTLARDFTAARSTADAIPWYAWTSVLATVCISSGLYWDISWHLTIGRDTFWTPAHLLIQFGAVLGGFAAATLIFGTSFSRNDEAKESSVRVLGFWGPVGAFLSAWGAAAMMISAPFDNWWHNAYGLDVKIISPPHTLLMLGVFAVSVGTLLLLIGAMNRASAAGNLETARHLQWLLLYVGGLMVVFQMFFRMEYTWDIYLHNSTAYQAMAIGMPTMFAILWQASRNRWASTWSTVIYTIFLIGAVLILPLFPAEPKLGPVYQQVTHFIPPKFPILLIVPGIFMDLLWNSTRKWKPWMVALATGPVFVISLVAVEWPFANFLMTPAAANRFFGAAYIGYSMPSNSFDYLRQFVKPEQGAELWSGLAWAAVFASLSSWLGIRLGRWMRGVQR
jgi:hypothetical protein